MIQNWRKWIFKIYL